MVKNKLDGVELKALALKHSKYNVHAIQVEVEDSGLVWTVEQPISQLSCM